jgi:copper chaperone
MENTDSSRYIKQTTVKIHRVCDKQMAVIARLALTPVSEMIMNAASIPQKVLLSVEGMSCGGCVQAVKRVIEKADPTAKADIHLETGRVEAETVIAADVLAQAVSKAGYPAHIIG